jgi:hypothetical protein
MSHVRKLPDDQFFISGIMDFNPYWHAYGQPPEEARKVGLQEARRLWGAALAVDNDWDAEVALVVDRELHIRKADIDSESVVIA